ncbi:hypothetical protein HT031_006492 [Scenedesmus sp. PABB004]|nr:hypothetical protein HT031_006492 [Scenedesmus sp. PABB004]
MAACEPSPDPASALREAWHGARGLAARLPAGGEAGELGALLADTATLLGGVFLRYGDEPDLLCTLESHLTSSAQLLHYGLLKACRVAGGDGADGADDAALAASAAGDVQLAVTVLATAVQWLEARSCLRRSRAAAEVSLAAARGVQLLRRASAGADGRPARGARAPRRRSSVALPASAPPGTAQQPGAAVPSPAPAQLAAGVAARCRQQTLEPLPPCASGEESGGEVEEAEDALAYRAARLAALSGLLVPGSTWSDAGGGGCFERAEQPPALAASAAPAAAPQPPPGEAGGGAADELDLERCGRVTTSRVPLPGGGGGDGGAAWDQRGEDGAGGELVEEPPAASQWLLEQLQAVYANPLLAGAGPQQQRASVLRRSLEACATGGGGGGAAPTSAPASSPPARRRTAQAWTLEGAAALQRGCSTSGGTAGSPAARQPRPHSAGVRGSASGAGAWPGRGYLAGHLHSRARAAAASASDPGQRQRPESGRGGQPRRALSAGGRGGATPDVATLTAAAAVPGSCGSPCRRSSAGPPPRSSTDGDAGVRRSWHGAGSGDGGGARSVTSGAGAALADLLAAAAAAAGRQEEQRCQDEQEQEQASQEQEQMGQEQTSRERLQEQEQLPAAQSQGGGRASSSDSTQGAAQLAEASFAVTQGGADQVCASQCGVWDGTAGSCGGFGAAAAAGGQPGVAPGRRAPGRASEDGRLAGTPAVGGDALAASGSCPGANTEAAAAGCGGLQRRRSEAEPRSAADVDTAPAAAEAGGEGAHTPEAAAAGALARGNAAYGAGSFSDAAASYRGALAHLGGDISAARSAEGVALWVKASLNLACCHLRLGEHQQCVALCDGLLEGEPGAARGVRAAWHAVAAHARMPKQPPRPETTPRLLAGAVDPANVVALCHRGRALLAAGQAAAARADLGEAQALLREEAAEAAEAAARAAVGPGRARAPSPHGPAAARGGELQVGGGRGAGPPRSLSPASLAHVRLNNAYWQERVAAALAGLKPA